MAVFVARPILRCLITFALIFGSSLSAAAAPSTAELHLVAFRALDAGAIVDLSVSVADQSVLTNTDDTF